MTGSESPSRLRGVVDPFEEVVQHAFLIYGVVPNSLKRQ